MVIPRGYKQTEVGVIPEDWYTDKLYGLVDVNSGESPSKFNITNGDTPYFKVEQLNNCSKYLSKTPYKVNSARKIIRDSSIFPKRGASIILNKVRILKYDSYFDTNLMSLTPKSDALTSEYLYYFLIHVELWRIADTTSIPQINNKHIKEVIISLPPKAEQTAIANVLTHIDELIASLQKLLEKKRAVKQGAMQELLTGKKRLPGFKGEWVLLNLSRNSLLKARIGWQGLTTAEYLKSGYSYLVTGTDFLNGSIAWNTCHYVDKYRYEQDKNIQIINDDILITKDGTIGKIAIVKNLTKKATLNSGVFVVRPLDENYSRRFVYYILLSQIFRDFLDVLSAGSTIIHLYQKDLLKFEFLIPPTLEEQSAIADILTNMDDEIEQLEQKLHKYENIKIGMMQNLLTGKIRLPTT